MVELHYARETIWDIPSISARLYARFRVYPVRKYIILAELDWVQIYQRSGWAYLRQTNESLCGHK